MSDWISSKGHLDTQLCPLNAPPSWWRALSFPMYGGVRSPSITHFGSGHCCARWESGGGLMVADRQKRGESAASFASANGRERGQGSSNPRRRSGSGDKHGGRESDAATAQHASYPSQFLFDMEEPAIGYPAAVRMVMKGEQGGDYGPCTATWHAAARRI